MDERYDPKKIEPAWQAEWDRTNLYLTREDPGRPKFYILEMFPYPSGAGLSVGHLHNYAACDGLGCVRAAGRERSNSQRIASYGDRSALRRELQTTADNFRMRL